MLIKTTIAGIEIYRTADNAAGNVRITEMSFAALKVGMSAQTWVVQVEYHYEIYVGTRKDLEKNLRGTKGRIVGNLWDLIGVGDRATKAEAVNG